MNLLSQSQLAALNISLILFLALSVTGCKPAGVESSAKPVETKPDATESTPATGSTPPKQPKSLAFLKSMPVNFDKRCIGIAVAMEQLEQGQPSSDDEPMTTSELAQILYEGIIGDQPIQYPSRIKLDEGDVSPIDSKPSLEEVSTKVAELYKNDFTKLFDQIGDAEFREELTDNISLNVKSLAHLKEIFADTENKKLMLSGFGQRQFPDGSAKGTSHAFILEQKGERFAVYDPNDPGKPFDATIEDREQGVWISWTSAYRDPNLITTQGYFVRTNERYFTRFFELLKKPE